jgi:hypothetical protein
VGESPPWGKALKFLSTTRWRISQEMGHEREQITAVYLGR